MPAALCRCEGRKSSILHISRAFGHQPPSARAGHSTMFIRPRWARWFGCARSAAKVRLLPGVRAAAPPPPPDWGEAARRDPRTAHLFDASRIVAPLLSAATRRSIHILSPLSRRMRAVGAHAAGRRPPRERCGRFARYRPTPPQRGTKSGSLSTRESGRASSRIIIQHRPRPLAAARDHQWFSHARIDTG